MFYCACRSIKSTERPRLAGVELLTPFNSVGVASNYGIRLSGAQHVRDILNGYLNSLHMQYAQKERLRVLLGLNF